MKTVFISYRRDDSAGHAGRLSDRLVARVGAARVFMDVEDIQPGQNFLQAIEQTLAKCDCLLAVVGPHWLEAIHARMATGEDFVRHEIAAALTGGLTVVPVLVGGARMPTASELPQELAAFARCQAVEIRDNRFDDDATRLVDFVAGGRSARRMYVAIAAAVAVALVVIGAFLMRDPVEAPATELDGTWVAEVRKPGQQPYRVGLTLDQDDTRLTGMVRYPTGDGPILDGRVDGGRITFRTMHIPQFESEPATILTEGTVEGDSVSLTMTDPTGTATGVARRADAGRQTDSRPVSRELPSLAYGTWTLRNAVDEQRKRWDNSVLQFTSQEEAGDGLMLRGRFTWRLDNQLIGTEDVEGRYVERTRQIILEGQRVTDPDRLAVGSYSAVLAPDERTLIQGRWGSTAQNEPGFAGEWEAVR